MKKHLSLAATFTVLGFINLVAGDLAQVADLSFAPGSMERPTPPRAEPLPEADLRTQAQAPAGAIILFDGHGLDAWNPTAWQATEAYIEVPAKPAHAKKINLTSRAEFGSCRLHLEWWTPADLAPAISGRDRSNSGVFLMGLYEIQILDSYQINSAADSIAGSIYGQFPPLANAVRPAGEWQYCDIEFHRPRFDEQSRLISPARLTVDLNGIRIQDNVQLTGPTGHKIRPPYAAHADKLPLSLQDHCNLVRFRNIWLTPLP